MAHGFVIGAEVIHPGPPPLGMVIATADKKFAKMDIGLAKITNSSIDYFPETFSGPSGTPTLETTPTPGEFLPFTGLESGLVVGLGVDVIPA